MSKKLKNRTETKLVNGVKESVVIEQDYRRNLLGIASDMGCRTELLQLFDKYDKLIKNCGNPKERDALQKLAVKAVSDLLDNGYLGLGGSLTAGGVLLLDDSKDRRDAGISKDLNIVEDKGSKSE